MYNSEDIIGESSFFEVDDYRNEEGKQWVCIDSKYRIYAKAKPHQNGHKPGRKRLQNILISQADPCISLVPIRFLKGRIKGTHTYRKFGIDRLVKTRDNNAWNLKLGFAVIFDERVWEDTICSIYEKLLRIRRGWLYWRYTLYLGGEMKWTRKMAWRKYG